MIVQIIPCTSELYAEYREGNKTFTNRIVCLALIEHDADPEEGEGDNRKYCEVVGMDVCDTEISKCDGNSNFVGYRATPIIDSTDSTLPPSAQGAERLQK